MSTPEQQPERPSSLTIGLVDTPAGQRLSVALTLLLDADGAKAFAKAITAAAEGMSSSGLVVANGVMR